VAAHRGDWAEVSVRFRMRLELFPERPIKVGWEIWMDVKSERMGICYVGGQLEFSGADVVERLLSRELEQAPFSGTKTSRRIASLWSSS
jgi:hypothetical protein